MDYIATIAKMSVMKTLLFLNSISPYIHVGLESGRWWGVVKWWVKYVQIEHSQIATFEGVFNSTYHKIW